MPLLCRSVKDCVCDPCPCINTAVRPTCCTLCPSIDWMVTNSKAGRPSKAVKNKWKGRWKSWLESFHLGQSKAEELAKKKRPCIANWSTLGIGLPVTCTAAGCISVSVMVSFHKIVSSIATSEVRSMALICSAPPTTAKGDSFCPTGTCKMEWKLRDEMLTLG